MAQVDAFLNKMYRSNADFVFTVTGDFVKSCQTPILILPDDVPAHPYAVALESAHLAPNAQVSIYPWKANPEQIQLALRHVRAFLKANRPASAAQQQPLAAAAQWLLCYGPPGLAGGIRREAMRTTLKVLAVASAVLAGGLSSAAMAKSHCAAGFNYYNHACHPVRSSGHGNSAAAPAQSPGYGNPVSGAVSGMQSGGAKGAASDGPVGAVVGGALGTASGAASGTSNMLLGR